MLENVAVTLRARLKDTLQVPVPEQLPLQPVKVEPLAALGVRATLVPEAKEVLQALPQVIPVGLLVTVPEPAPALVTVRV